MKIAYLGKIQLSDVDLSYINEAQQSSDVTYIMEVCPRFLTGPAFNIKEIYPRSGLFKAVDIYPEFQKLQGFIDLDKFYVLNTCGRLWVLKSFWTNFLLLLFLIRGRFTSIHLAWPPNIYEFILYLLSNKMLLTVHDPFPHTAHDSLIVRIRRKLAFNLIRKLIILNKAQRQEFLSYYHLSPQRVIDSQLSIYTYLKTVEPCETDIPSKGSYILFAGRISPYKGLDYLFPAMEKVHQLCPDCKIVVAGKGKYHFDITSYQQQTDYFDIRNRFIADNEMVALIKNCAFMVCPYTDATQSGVIMSAFAFNKPVIATNVGGLPEMVKHGHYGLIIEARDEQSLTDAIVELWQHPAVLEQYSHEIQADYHDGELSWKAIAKDLTEEYRNTGK